MASLQVAFPIVAFPYLLLGTLFRDWRFRCVFYAIPALSYHGTNLYWGYESLYRSGFFVIFGSLVGLIFISAGSLGVFAGNRSAVWRAAVLLGVAGCGIGVLAAGVHLIEGPLLPVSPRVVIFFVGMFATLALLWPLLRSKCLSPSHARQVLVMTVVVVIASKIAEIIETGVPTALGSLENFLFHGAWVIPSWLAVVAALELTAPTPISGTESEPDSVDPHDRHA